MTTRTEPTPQHTPTLGAEWTPDCQGKQDYDADILSLSTRYWPRGGGFSALDSRTGKWEENADRPEINPSAHATIYLRSKGDDIALSDERFEGDTEGEVKAKVEAWAAEQYDLIVRALTSHAALVEALEESTAALAYLAEYALPLAGFRLADGLLDRNNAALAAAKVTP